MTVTTLLLLPLPVEMLLLRVLLPLLLPIVPYASST